MQGHLNAWAHLGTAQGLPMLLRRLCAMGSFCQLHKFEIAFSFHRFYLGLHYFTPSLSPFFSLLEIFLGGLDLELLQKADDIDPRHHRENSPYRLSWLRQPST